VISFPAVAIVGPTASGKSALAERVAERFDATIVSVDSMQVYRDMDIGTAKPDIVTRRRIPHRMIDIVEPSGELSAHQFQRIGRDAMRESIEHGSRIVISGGSGLHFRCLVDPLTFAPTDVAVRETIASHDHRDLVERLVEVDPRAGSHTDLDNPRRVVRALEILELTGETPSQRAAKPEAIALAAYTPVVDFIGIGLDGGDDQRRRVTERLARMMDRGFLDEVASLDGRLGPTAREAVGYKELLGVVAGERTLPDAMDDIIRSTMSLVKRQRTYFRRDPRIAWLPWQDEDGRNLDDIVDMIGERASWTS
jgi:tRNA dimethylallyltransferase